MYSDMTKVAPALDKGLDIIELLSTRIEGLTQSEIATTLNRTQSEIYRMLTTLVHRGYVVKSNMDNRYSLSLKLFALSQYHPPIDYLLEVSSSKMRELAIRSWQSCHLGVENNGEIVIIVSVSSPGNWSMAIHTGSVIGLSNTGTGRVLAAFRSDEDLQHLIKKHRLAVGEPEIDKKLFYQQIEEIREQGFDRRASATVVGVSNLSYPILDLRGQAVAVLTCPYLERIDEFKIPSEEKVHCMLQHLAKELSDYYQGSPHWRGVQSMAQQI